MRCRSRDRRRRKATGEVGGQDTRAHIRPGQRIPGAHQGVQGMDRQEPSMGVRMGKMGARRRGMLRRDGDD